MIRGGTVIDGTGAPARLPMWRSSTTTSSTSLPNIVGRASRVIDATDRIVTPGFVDIHTHLDAQLAWDPIGSSSCYHGITSVVMGNCGVTFAPCKPEDREILAAMMESVEDIPRDAILDGLAWDWVTYGEYLDSVGRMPKGLNVGGMVGHCALRQYAMGERGIEQGPPTADDLATMTDLLAEAMRGGALGFSTSRTFLHKVPDGRPVPGTYAEPDELFAFADVLGRQGAGVFESASRIGEGDRDDADIPGTRAEMAWMGEVSRRSGRPVSFGLLQHDSRPDLYAQVIELAKYENIHGANVRPQTTARSVGVLFSLDTRSPFDRASCWRELREMRNGQEADGSARSGDASPIDRGGRRDATKCRPRLSCSSSTRSTAAHGRARYDLDPSTSLAADRHHRGISAAAAYIELQLESDGALMCSFPFLNQSAGGRREHARRKACHARFGRRRCPRRSDTRCQPANLSPVVLDPRTSTVEPGGGRPPAHQ